MSPRTFIEPLKEPSRREEPVLPLDGQLAPAKKPTASERRAMADEVRRSIGIVSRKVQG
jgi:hypothetical protein